MMLKNQIMKLQTYKMYEGEDTVYVERDDVLKILEQQPCEDWYDVPSDEMTLEQARQAVKDLRKKLAEYLEQQPTPRNHLETTSQDLENKYEMGYNCGYADAMSDIAERR